LKRSVAWLSGVALFVAALWIGWSFRAGNASSVDLDLIWLRLEGVALWWVILMAGGAGALLAGGGVGFAWLRARLLNRRYRKRIRQLESELHQLRSLPLAGSGDAALESGADRLASERS